MNIIDVLSLIVLFGLLVVSLGVSFVMLFLFGNILFGFMRYVTVKNLAVITALLGFSFSVHAGYVKSDDPMPITAESKGLHGCDAKKLVLSIPTVDNAKAVQICHVNGLTFNLKYGKIGKPEIDFNFMGLKSGGFEGVGNGANAFAYKGDYAYSVSVGKEISEFTVEYKKGTKYQKVEMARLVNNLDKSQWRYWEKFMENTNYAANNIEIKH